MSITPRALVLALALAAGGCASFPGNAEPRYGVCRQQMMDFVGSTLGHTVTRIEIQAYAERSPPIGLFDAGSALVYVEECDGFHAFEVRATETICEHIPHYGTGGGSFVRYEGAFSGCKSS